MRYHDCALASFCFVISDELLKRVVADDVTIEDKEIITLAQIFLG